MLDPMSARWASSCSRNGISEDATEAIDGITEDEKTEESLINDGAAAEIADQKDMPLAVAEADSDVVDSKPAERAAEPTVEGQSLAEDSATGSRPENRNECAVMDQSTVMPEALENTAGIQSPSDDSIEIIEGAGEEA